MHARCVIELDGAVYGLEVETLSHRRFKGEGAALHVHPSYHLILVSQGSCRFHRAGQPSVTAAKGSLIIIDPLVPHGFTGAPGTGVEHSSLIWRFRNRRGEYALFPLRRLAGADDREPAGSMVKRLSAFDASAFLHKQRATEAAYAEGMPLIASLLAFELFSMGLTQVCALAPDGGADRQGQLVARVKALVERDIADPGLGVAAIAREIGLNPSHLNAVFNGREGVPISQYLIHRRVALVKALLEGSACTIAEAAAHAGFNRASYFSRVFRKHCGMSPSAFRDRVR